MARWRKGEQQVASLIEQRHLQQVAADSQTAAALLASAGVTLRALAGPLTPTLKPPTPWPTTRPARAPRHCSPHQGLRPTTSGGHIAVDDAIRAQFPGVPGLTSLDRLRRRRNQAEYPNPTSYDPIIVDEANDAIQAAGECVSSASRLLQLDEPGIF